MAGSLNHIIGNDGTFMMAFIENLGDAHEALEECFHIIRVLADGDMNRVSAVCEELKFPDPYKLRTYEDPKEPMRIGGKDAFAVPGPPGSASVEKEKR